MTAPSQTPSNSPPTASAPEIPLPSTAKLAKATGIALVSAVMLLVFVVLPAEYNLDPTGFGRAIGLTRLSAPVEAAVNSPAPNDDTPGAREDRVVVEVPPETGVEYKFSLRAGEKMKYAWSADKGALEFDFHGEPKGDTTGFFESYTVSTANETKGTFTAPFDGTHGWYWKNTGRALAKVTLTTSGSYEVVGLPAAARGKVKVTAVEKPANGEANTESEDRGEDEVKAKEAKKPTADRKDEVVSEKFAKLPFHAVGPVAKVNGVEVSADTFNQEVIRMTRYVPVIPPGEAEKYKTKVLENVIDKTLLDQEIAEATVEKLTSNIKNNPKTAPKAPAKSSKGHKHSRGGHGHSHGHSHGGRKHSH